MLDTMAKALRVLPVGAGPAMPAQQRHTLGEWLDVYEQTLCRQGYKAQTLRNRHATIGHLRRLWGSRDIESIKPREVDCALRGEFFPAHSSTACRVLAELRTAYEDAIVDGWAMSNPAAHVRLPMHHVMRSRLRFETWQSMRQLSRASPQKWVESMLLLALVTGQRRADLAAMRFADVVQADDGQQVLRIEQRKQAGKGYGARVEIPTSLRLEAIGMTVSDVIEHCHRSALPGPTLLRKAGGGAIEESSLSARFHECIVAVLGAEAHALHEWPSLHEVRSLAARLYRAQGVDVQTLLGHKHAEMTSIYEDDRGLSRHEWKRVMKCDESRIHGDACLT